tara:strand:- start:10833 stop:11660 length:828 start_codon:yes stop_codon:yes gene_type:complete
MNKLIINFTPNGMIPTKDLTPHVPISPDEIISEAIESTKFGVSMIHLHARDQSGNPTYQKEIYEQIVGGIKKINKDIIICVSTSGRSWSEFEKRSECLELTGSSKPDMGSLTLSSLNFNKQASVNSPKMIQMLAKKMLDNNIKPELEAFDVGMINYAKYLHKKGLIEPPFYFNLILGNIACAQANILNLGLMINELPADSIWSVGGIGDAQLPMNVHGMTSGGGVRVGIEDNIWFTTKRDKLATNMDLLKRIKNIADALNLEVATPQEARKLLKL